MCSLGEQFHGVASGILLSALEYWRFSFGIVFAYKQNMTTHSKGKKVLIIDEHGFSRICSAILMSDGYQTDVVTLETDLLEKLKGDSVSLIVTSYPYGTVIFESLQTKNIPIIILSDGIDERLMHILNNLQNSRCMIKPVDYDQFKNMVKQAVEGSLTTASGFSIV
jgi:DNA-binding NtrC family response regulator